MYHWRNAIGLGIAFILVGVVYYWLQGSGEWMDRTGATLLVVLGAAMMFAFIIVLRGAREL